MKKYIYIKSAVCDSACVMLADDFMPGYKDVSCKNIGYGLIGKVLIFEAKDFKGAELFLYEQIGEDKLLMDIEYRMKKIKKKYCI